MSTASRPRTRKPRTLTAVPSEFRRLPEALRLLGDVAIARPITPGATAHRYAVRTVMETVPAPTHLDPDLTVEERIQYVTAGCWTPTVEGEVPPPYAALSAGYADATYQVTACPSCFPADPPEGTRS